MISDSDECVLNFLDQSLSIPIWTSYSFHSEFLTPANGFLFTIGDPSIPGDLTGSIRLGQKVSITIGNVTSMTGIIDEVHSESSRSGGTILSFSGRDTLADAIDSIIDPNKSYKPTQSLAVIVQDVMLDYGFTSITADNDANRNLVVGNKYGQRTNPPSSGRRHSRKSKAGQATNAEKTYQSKPHEHEGAYEFCERLAKRQGLHIRSAGDGKTLLVAKPDYDQEPTFSIVRKKGALAGSANNVLSGHVNRSRTDQPSVIVAAGTAGGNSFARARNKSIMVNWTVGLNADGSYAAGIANVLQKYPKAIVVNLEDLYGGKPEKLFSSSLNPSAQARPLYLFDSEAQTAEQLENFVIREMGQRQHRSLSCTYEVYGHSQNGNVWAVDTVASVFDDVGAVYENMWVESVQFSKSRAGGTKTHVTLSRLYSLSL